MLNEKNYIPYTWLPSLIFLIQLTRDIIYLELYSSDKNREVYWGKNNEKIKIPCENNQFTLHILNVVYIPFFCMYKYYIESFPLMIQRDCFRSII